MNKRYLLLVSMFLMCLVVFPFKHCLAYSGDSISGGFFIQRQIQSKKDYMDAKNAVLRNKRKEEIKRLTFFNEVHALSGWGISGQYPWGGSLTYSVSMFMLDADLGRLSYQEENIVLEPENRVYEYYTDENNYAFTEIQKTILSSSKHVFGFTPSLYFYYFSIGCGFGIYRHTEYISKTRYYTKCYYEVITTGNTTSISSGSTTQSTSIAGESSSIASSLVISPKVKGFIPLGSEGYDGRWFLSVCVGYDFVCKVKEESGFKIGIGLHNLLY